MKTNIKGRLTHPIQSHPKIRRTTTTALLLGNHRHLHLQDASNCPMLPLLPFSPPLISLSLRTWPQEIHYPGSQENSKPAFEKSNPKPSLLEDHHPWKIVKAKKWRSKLKNKNKNQIHYRSGGWSWKMVGNHFHSLRTITQEKPSVS